MRALFILFFTLLSIYCVSSGHIFSQPTEIQPQNQKYASRFHIFFSVDTPLVAGDYLVVKFPFNIGLAVTAQLTTNVDVSGAIAGFLTRASGTDPEHFFLLSSPIPAGVWHRLLIRVDPTTLGSQTFGPQGCINLQTASADTTDRIIYDTNSCLDYISLGPDVDTTIFKVFGQYTYTQQTALTSFGQTYTAFFDVFPNVLVSDGAIVTLTIAGTDFGFGSSCQSVSCLVGSTDPDCPSTYTYNITQVLGSCTSSGQTLTFTLTQDVTLNPFRIRTSIVNPNTVATSGINAVYKSRRAETWFASVAVQPNSLNPLALTTNYPNIQASSAVLLFWGIPHAVVSSSGFIGCPIYLYKTGATIPIFNSIRTIVSISTTINSFRALNYLHTVWYPAEISTGVTILMSSVRSTFPVVSVSGIKSFCSLAGNGVNCTFIDTLNSGNSYTISGKIIIANVVVATSATSGKVEFYRGDSTSNKIGTSTAPSIAIKLNKEYLDHGGDPATKLTGIISKVAFGGGDVDNAPLTTDAKLALTAMSGKSRLQTSSYNVFHSYLNPSGTIKYKLDVGDSGLNSEHVLPATLAAFYDTIIADFYDFGRSGVFLRPSTSAESENWGLLMMLSSNVEAEICQDIPLSLEILAASPGTHCWAAGQKTRVYVMLKIIFNNNVLNINVADFSAGVLIVGTMFSVRGTDKYTSNGYLDVTAFNAGTVDLQTNLDIAGITLGSFRTKSSIVNYGGTNPFTYSQNFILSTGNFWHVTIICNPLAATETAGLVAKTINCGTIGQSIKAATNLGSHTISGIAFQKTKINIYPSQYADTYVFDFLQCFKCIKKASSGGWDGTSTFNENNWILTENFANDVQGYKAGTAVYNAYVIQGISTTVANNYKSTASFVNYYYDVTPTGKTFGPGTYFASYIRVHAILGTSLTTSGTQISIFIDGSPTVSTDTGATYTTLKSYASTFREVSVVDHFAGASTMATVFQGYDEPNPRAVPPAAGRYLNDLWISKSGFTYNSNIGTTNAEVNVYIPVIGRIISLDSVNIAVLGTPNIQTGISPIIGVFRVFGSWYQSSLKMSPAYPTTAFFPDSVWPDSIIGTNTLFWPKTPSATTCVGAATVVIKTQIKSTSSSSDFLPSKTYSSSVAFSGQVPAPSVSECKINLGNNLVSSLDPTSDLSANGDVVLNWGNSKTIGSAFIVYSRDTLYNIFNPTSPLAWFGGPNNKCVFNTLRFCQTTCTNIYTIVCQADKISSGTDANYGSDSTLVTMGTFTVPFFWGLNYLIADKLQYAWSNLVGQGVYVGKDSSQTTDWIFKTCIASQVNGIPQNTLDVSYTLALTNAITYILEAGGTLVVSQEFTSAISSTAINFALCDFPGNSLISCTNTLSLFTLKNNDLVNKVSISSININVIVDTVGTTANTHWAKVLFNGATTEYCSQANPVQFSVDASKGLSDITFGSSQDFKYTNMKRARGTFFFTFSFARIIRKNNVFTFNLGFFSTPTQSSNNFRCQILNSNGIVSNNFRSISTNDLTRSYVTVKSTMISGGSFRYKCAGGQTTDYSTGTTNNIIATYGRSGNAATPIANTINPITPGLIPPDTVSINSVSLEKNFRTKGFDAEYIISFIPSVTNITYSGRIYVEFPLSVPPKLNYAGSLNCYLDENPVFCELLDERRVSVWPNKILYNTNPTTYRLRISGVTQPNSGDVQSNPELYLALDTNDNSFDSIAEQVFISDPFDTSLNFPGIIYLHDLTYTVNKIRQTTSISVLLNLPANSVLQSNFLYAQLPASLDNSLFYSPSTSCSLRRLNDATNTEYATSCAVVRGRKVIVNLGSDSLNNVNLNYTLTLSNILTPQQPSSVSTLFRETIRVFISPDNQTVTYTTAAGNRNTSTYFNWIVDPNTILLNWLNSQSTRFGGLLDVSTGHYGTRAFISVAQGNFNNTFNWQFAGANGTNFIVNQNLPGFTASSLIIKSGFPTSLIFIGAKETTPPGRYYLSTLKNGDVYNAYSPLPYLDIRVVQSVCTISPSLTTLSIPAGGFSNPIVLDFNNCPPMTDITVFANLTQGANLFLTFSNGQSSNSQNLKFDSILSNYQLYYYLNSGNPFKNLTSGSATIAFTLSGTDAPFFAISSTVSVNIIAPTTELPNVQTPTVISSPGKVDINLGCSQPGLIYFALGLKVSVVGTSIGTIRNKTENALTRVSKLDVNDENYKIYGYITYTQANVARTVSLAGVLKAGDNYTLISYCMNQLNVVSNNTGSVTWIQPDNGGKTVAVQMIFKNADISAAQKLEIACGLSRFFAIPPARVRTDEGAACNVLRNLQGAVVDNSTNNTTPNITTYYPYNWFVVKDYLVDVDNLYQTVQSSMRDPSFTNKVFALTSLGVNGFPVVNATSNLVIDSYTSQGATVPVLTATAEIANWFSIGISITLTNIQGYVYCGIGPADAATPTLTQLRFGLDGANSALINRYYKYLENNTRADFNFTGLSNSTNYTLFWGGNNLDTSINAVGSGVFPRIVSTTAPPNTFGSIMNVSFMVICLVLSIMIVLA